MSAPTAPKSSPGSPQRERSFPTIEFTDAEAGAKEFPSSKSRKYNYYQPAKKRATVYEDVTVDVQPDPERHLTQGWIYGFGNGPGGYPQEWTAAKSSNWHAFLDPNEEWEQTIYRNNSAVATRSTCVCRTPSGPGSTTDGIPRGSNSSSATSAPGCMPRAEWASMSSPRSRGRHPPT